MEPTAIRKPELVGPGIRRIQQPQPDQTGGHGQFWPKCSVDEDIVTLEPGHLVHMAKVVGHHTAPEQTVLDDQRDVILAIGPWQGHVDLRVIEQDQSGQSPVDLHGGLSVDVAVIPECGRRVIDGKLGCPGLAGLERQLRPAVEVAGQVHPVPMRGDRCVDAIFDRDLRGAPFDEAQCRTEVVLRKTKRGRGDTRGEFPRSGSGCNRVPGAAIDVHEWRDRQRGARLSRDCVAG